MADEQQDSEGDGSGTGEQGQTQGETAATETLQTTPHAAPPNAAGIAAGNAAQNAAGSPDPNVARARVGKPFQKGAAAWNKGLTKMNAQLPSGVPLISAQQNPSPQTPQTPQVQQTQTPQTPQTPPAPKSESEVEIDEAAELEKPEGAYEMPEFKQGAKLAPPLPRELSMLARALKLYVPDKDIKEAVWDYFSNVPSNELNQWTLYNSLSAHRVKDATNNWIVRYVFPPNAVQNPYAPPGGDGNPYPNPQYAATRQTLMEETSPFRVMLPLERTVASSPRRRS